MCDVFTHGAHKNWTWLNIPRWKENARGIVEVPPAEVTICLLQVSCSNGDHTAHICNPGLMTKGWLTGCFFKKRFYCIPPPPCTHPPTHPPFTSLSLSWHTHLIFSWTQYASANASKCEGTEIIFPVRAGRQCSCLLALLRIGVCARSLTLLEEAIVFPKE